MTGPASVSNVRVNENTLTYADKVNRMSHSPYNDSYEKRLLCEVAELALVLTRPFSMYAQYNVAE